MNTGKGTGKDAQAGLACEETTVGVWETNEARWPVIEQTCAACGTHACRLSLSSLSHCARFAAAIVGLRRHPDIPSDCLNVVVRLKEAGVCVIAHEIGLSHWALSARCRVLLAGARYLFDSESSDFQQALRNTLGGILQALAERRTEEGRIRGLARANGIVGESESLLAAFRQVVRMSELSDHPVLITGESGTGKELFASALHALDPKRCRGPFVAVNCAAISTGLAESQFFGHVRGAFTGAARDYGGLFLAAQGGVLFLDEIAELAPEVQAKLLRVVQERRVLQVGASADASVDIRIVAATNQDLAQLVKEGRFRGDLYHRLHSLAIHIDPLRERHADLPSLVALFESQCRAGRPSCGIDPELIDALCSLRLPGNVRELKNLLTAALAAKTDQRPLGLQDMPQEVWSELSCAANAGKRSESRVGQDAVDSDALPVEGSDAISTRTGGPSLALDVTAREGWNLSRCLSACEREIVVAALSRTRNNRSQAARLLGLTPRSIYNKLRKHELLGHTLR